MNLRRYFLKYIFICFTLLFSINTVDAQYPVTFTDVSGQTITLEKPAERLLIGEGRSLLAFSLINDDPVKRIAGWMADFLYLGEELNNAYKEVFPAIEDIPLVGQMGVETFSIEKALAINPDIVVFGMDGHGPGINSEDVLRQLRAAGIPVVFVDFRGNPFVHTVPSIRVLGNVTGEQEKAEAFIEFYDSRIKLIESRIASQENLLRPKVLLEMHAGFFSECCTSPGTQSLGKFIEFAGGENIGASVIPGAIGNLSTEYILSENPDIYIGTGVERSIRDVGIEMGADVNPDDAISSLRVVVDRTGINALKAVENDKIHAIWHNFYNSPLNILALEAMATWFHPELFHDLDPEQTLELLNEEFLAVPMEGTFWVKAK